MLFTGREVRPRAVLKTEGTITRNHGHFKPVNNCQRYIMLRSRTIKSNMAAVIARSERKRVSYDVLHRLSTVDILYAENRKKRRSQVKCMVNSPSTALALSRSM